MEVAKLLILGECREKYRVPPYSGRTDFLTINFFIQTSSPSRRNKLRWSNQQACASSKSDAVWFFEGFYKMKNDDYLKWYEGDFAAYAC